MCLLKSVQILKIKLGGEDIIGCLFTSMKFNPHLIFCLVQTPPVCVLFCPFHLQTLGHLWNIFFHH